MEERRSLTSHKPPGRIHGRVVDAVTGEPVAGAAVRIRDDIVVVDLQTTNRRGEFTSRLLFAGTYDVEVEHEGRLASAFAVVKLDETTTVSMELPG